jgi:molybdopterin-guanine dinucleotide biosynthesis protein A
MGRDKALLPSAGRVLIAHAVSTLREAGLQTSIAGAASSARASLAAYAPVVDDSEPGLGPLAGICAAFAATSTRFAVFLPVDLPLLPPSLIATLLHHARITGHAVNVPSVNGFIQTFPAVLERSALPALQNKLHSGQRGCFSAFRAAAGGLGQPIASLAVELLAQSGQVSHPFGLPPFRWFLNVNTPQDLRRAEELIARAIA